MVCSWLTTSSPSSGLQPAIVLARQFSGLQLVSQDLARHLPGLQLVLRLSSP
jgi:hypothetical protein